MIPLKDFIKETLLQITQGIVEANAELADTDVRFAPPGHAEKGESLDAVKVDFDVLVSATEGTSGSAGGQGGLGVNIKVFTAQIGGKAVGDSKHENLQTQRIQFSIWTKFWIDESAKAEDQKWREIARAQNEQRKRDDDYIFGWGK